MSGNLTVKSHSQTLQANRLEGEEDKESYLDNPEATPLYPAANLVPLLWILLLGVPAVLVILIYDKVTSGL